MRTSSSAPTASRRTSLARLLLLCLVAGCVPQPVGEPETLVVATRTECAAAAENEARRIVYRDTIRQLATKARTAAQRGPKSSVRAAPAAPAVHARAEVARQDTEAVLRTGGASTTTEPQPHYYWDDCVMVGLAMMPHCGT